MSTYQDVRQAASRTLARGDLTRFDLIKLRLGRNGGQTILVPRGCAERSPFERITVQVMLDIWGHIWVNMAGCVVMPASESSGVPSTYSQN